ncbi:MAG: hypothetical protein FWE06_09585 [Oscillospiraceae bacterium]|nr:hypothetical protein [Oscillospiraceae bacterium]
MTEQEKLAREEEFKTNLSGELLVNALEFVNYMDETCGIVNDPFNPRAWLHKDYAGEIICFTVTDSGNFYIFVDGPESSVCNSDFDKYPISDEMKEFVYSHIQHCSYMKSDGKECGCSEKRWRNFTILGRKYENLCYCCICFKNPDTETFEKLKELVPIWKLCIDAVKQAEK